MRTPLFWYVLLVVICMIAPYVLGVRPVSRSDWVYLRTAIGFLTWLLIGVTVVRAM